MLDIVRTVRVPRSVSMTKIEPDETKHDLQSCYELNTAFTNWLPYPVYVIDRSGIVSKVPKRSMNPRRMTGVEIVRTWNFSGAVNFDHSGLLGVTSSLELQAIRSALHAAQDRPGLMDRCTVPVRYHLSEEDFNAVGKSTYLSEVDLVITAEDPMQYYVHPSSEATIRSVKASGEAYSTYWQIAAVDSQSDIKSLYVNLNGDVFKVIPEKNPGLRDGVYVYTRNKGGAPTGELLCRHLSFDQAFKELPIFGTAKEAEAYGNLEQRMERELEIRKSNLKIQLMEAEAEVKRLGLENAEAKERFAKMLREMEVETKDWERRNAEYDRQIVEQKQRSQREAQEYEARIQREKAAREVELQRLKDHYEARSHLRKDTSESMKHLPLILGGVAALAVFFK